MLSGAQTTDLTSLTIAQASARLAKREITPLQLTNAYLARIDKLNKDLNAYVTVTRDLARSEAKRCPIPGRRCCDRCTASRSRTRISSKPRACAPPPARCSSRTTSRRPTPPSCEQLEDAGAVLVGKTNTHELGGGVTTINPFFGTTRNPVDRTRIPGGSSGGSAAAVAAHLCVAATGSDTGGSVRIPAAFCGCVGFKPTFGRISTRGLIAASPIVRSRGLPDENCRRCADRVFRVGSAVPSGGVAPPAPIRIGVARNYFFDALDAVVADASIGTIEGVNASRRHVSDVRFPDR